MIMRYAMMYCIHIEMISTTSFPNDDQMTDALGMGSWDLTDGIIWGDSCMWRWFSYWMMILLK